MRLKFVGSAVRTLLELPRLTPQCQSPAPLGETGPCVSSAILQNVRPRIAIPGLHALMLLHGPFDGRLLLVRTGFIGPGDKHLRREHQAGD